MCDFWNHDFMVEVCQVANSLTILYNSNKQFPPVKIFIEKL